MKYLALAPLLAIAQAGPAILPSAEPLGPDFNSLIPKPAPTHETEHHTSAPMPTHMPNPHNKVSNHTSYQTTCATLTYEAFCSTGLSTKTEEVSFTCPPGPYTHSLPPGYVVTVATCHECGPKPLTKTLTTCTSTPTLPAPVTVAEATQVVESAPQSSEAPEETSEAVASSAAASSNNAAVPKNAAAAAAPAASPAAPAAAGTQAAQPAGSAVPVSPGKASPETFTGAAAKTCGVALSWVALLVLPML